MFNLIWHELRSRWGTILGWGIGIGMFGALYIGIWPEAGESMQQIADLSIYQAMGVDMVTFEGYIASVVIQYLPLLLGIYAIIASTGTLAGEEESGTLELIVAAPLSRLQIVTVKALALSIVVFLMILVAALINMLVLNAIRGLTEVNVTSAEFVTAHLGTWPLTVTFIMMGLFLGAFLPSRRIAALTMTVIFIASYFGLILVNFVESLESIKVIFLFNYLNSSATVFTEGQQAEDVALLLGLALIFFGLALLSFQRRNVTVGAWPWQRARVSG